MSYDSVVLADSPVWYPKLEELTPPGPAPNNDCIDSSGNGHHGTLAPQPADFVQAITGPILTDASSFGCAGPIARVPGIGNADTFTPVNATTWECWTKKSGSGVETMINRGANVVSDMYLTWNQVQVGTQGDRVVFGLDWGPDGAFGLTSCQLENDTWYHVVGTREGAEMKLYVDGWLVDSRSDVPSTPLIPDTGQPWRLGYFAHAVFGAVNWSTGLSHVAIYDTALTQAQIRVHTIAALGELPDNPCGDTPEIEVGCPVSVGTVGAVYDSEVVVVGGTPPYTFAVISGALPGGLTLNPATGEITGTATEAGTFSFVIQATDADLLTGESPGCEIVIDAVPPGPPTRTMRFGAGLTGNSWYIVSSITDSSDELRSKTVKSPRITGKVTNAKLQLYTWDVLSAVNMQDLEAGANSTTGDIPTPDTTDVVQSAIYGANCPNAVLSAIRAEGNWDGTGVPDRVDELVYQLAIAGVRR